MRGGAANPVRVRYPKLVQVRWISHRHLARARVVHCRGERLQLTRRGVPCQERETMVWGDFQFNQKGSERWEHIVHDPYHFFRLHRLISKESSPLIRHGVHPLHKAFGLVHGLS